MNETAPDTAATHDPAIQPRPHVAGYLGETNAECFALYHPAVGPQKPCAVVICNPLGFEAIRAHRPLRYLAEQLSAAGFPTLRFDYHGTGDSTGTDEDPARVEAWLNSLQTAIRTMEAETGATTVCLVGMRMGATLAALAAAEHAVSHLVLWEPCLTGRAYTREMAIVASASLKALLGGPAADSPGLEAGGFVLTPETQEQLGGIKLLETRPLGKPDVLVIGREDQPENRTLPDHYVGLGLSCEYHRMPGYTQMMGAPKDQVVPQATHDTIVDWLTTRVSASPVPTPTAPSLAPHLTLTNPDGPGHIVESPRFFGPDDRLFGILTEPETGADPSLPAVILLPGGSVPRTSATRMYVPLARRLATRGLTVFRMDVSGIGDSLAAPNVPDNDAYTPALLSDVKAAMDIVTTPSSEQPIHLLGLCSGAYAGFATALDTPQVAGITLINPLVFHLSEGMSLDTPSVRHFRDAAHYRAGLLSPRTWLRLLRGQVNVRRAAATLLRQLRLRLGPRRPKDRGTLDEGRLAGDLRRLAQRNVAMGVVFSHGDPGYDALMQPAGGTVRTLEKEGHLTLQIFERTDHIFSPSAARTALLDWVVDSVRGGRTRTP